jgi:peptidyl-prolyl cis-trans isomerase SurA
MIWLFAVLACGEAEPEPPAAEAVAEPSEPSALVDAPAGPRPERIAARHILAKVSPIERGGDKGEAARALIAEAQARLAAGEDFRLVAADLSEDASSRRGGTLAVAEYETWVPAFSDVAFALEVGEISGVVETEFGYHIIQRIPLDERHLQQIVVRYASALGASSHEVTRSEDEALALAEHILVELEAGMDFEEAARTWSEGPMGPRGGDIGVVLVGELGVGIEEAVAELDIGETSGVVRSPFGVHILKRVE